MGHSRYSGFWRLLPEYRLRYFRKHHWLFDFPESGNPIENHVCHLPWSPLTKNREMPEYTYDTNPAQSNNPGIRDYFLPRKTPLSPLGGQVVHGVPSLETATCWAFPEKLVITSIERLATFHFPNLHRRSFLLLTVKKVLLVWDRSFSPLFWTSDEP